MAGRFVLFKALCFEADGKAALSQLVGGSITGTMRLRHDGWRRIRVDRHGGLLRGRISSTSHRRDENVSALKWYWYFVYNMRSTFRNRLEIQGQARKCVLL